MSTYQCDHTPFIYIIGWTELNAWYLGAKWARGCSPVDLWTTYFTSSKVVADIREAFGEPDCYQTFVIGSASETIKAEYELLTDLGLWKADRWLNKSAFSAPDGSQQMWDDPVWKAWMCTRFQGRKFSPDGLASRKAHRRARSKLSSTDVKAIFADVRTCRAIAEDFGVSPDAVSKIKSGKRYADLTGQT